MFVQFAAQKRSLFLLLVAIIIKRSSFGTYGSTIQSLLPIATDVVEICFVVNPLDPPQ